MSSTTLVSASEYLATSYRPDCDYIDGELQERSSGEYDHGDLLSEVLTRLRSRKLEWRIRVITALRVQVSPTRFRVPNICVMSADSPREQIVRHPPILCIEVLSPEDTLHCMRDCIRDFLAMGVRQVWLLDPATRTAIVCDGVAMVEQAEGSLHLPGTPITLNLPELFAVLDEG